MDHVENVDHEENELLFHIEDILFLEVVHEVLGGKVLVEIDLVGHFVVVVHEGHEVREVHLEDEFLFHNFGTLLDHVDHEVHAGH